MQKILVIFGPTGSGKTELAHYLALKYSGEVINIDALQVYKQIPIITSSPSFDFKKEVKYHLYNFLDVKSNFSVYDYIFFLKQVVEQVVANSKLPIIVGGSGMYIYWLMYGYNILPKISLEIQKHVEFLYESMGKNDFCKFIANFDQNLINDTSQINIKRLLKAYSIYLQTGKSLKNFLKNGKKFIFSNDYYFETIFLFPERDFLYNTCDIRLKAIFANGAIDEIKLISKYGIDNIGPAKYAIGIKEIIYYLNSEISYDDALYLAQQRTKKYAKRQITWFKNKILNQKIVNYSSRQEFLFRITTI